MMFWPKVILRRSASFSVWKVLSAENGRMVTTRCVPSKSRSQASIASSQGVERGTTELRSFYYCVREMEVPHER